MKDVKFKNRKSIKIIRVLSGYIYMPKYVLSPEKNFNLVCLPVYYYIIQRNQQLIMIDTGISKTAESIEPKTPFYKLRYQENSDFQTIFMKFKYSIENIQGVILTHSHVDHSGQVTVFPPRKVLLSDQEAAFVKESQQINPLLDSGHFKQMDQFQILKEKMDAPEFEYNDEDLILFKTPGHSPGHLSVIFKAVDRCFLFCGDSAYQPEALTGVNIPRFTADKDVYRNSIERIKFYQNKFKAEILYHHYPDPAGMNPINPYEIVYSEDVS